MQINAETGHKTTYSKIFQDTVNTATGLRKLGVKRGDVLAFCSENRDEYIAAALGAVCCGATITTTNMQYSKGEILTWVQIFTRQRRALKLLGVNMRIVRVSIKTFHEGNCIA